MAHDRSANTPGHPPREAASQASTITVDGDTRVIPLMAWPTSHLRTPTLFNALCAANGVNALMLPWAVRPAELARAWQGLSPVHNLAGIVLTIPHKQAAALLCDRLEGDAAVLGVVNVVRRGPDGTYTGRVYDGFGLTEGMLRRGIELAGKRVLLLGAGGAATAIALSIARQDVALLTIANRSIGKATILAEMVSRSVPGVRVETGPAEARGYDVIVNATSLGMLQDDPMPLNPSGICANSVVAEVVMSPAHTPLLSAAVERGARIHHGEHMVSAQLDHLMDFLLG